MHEVHKGHSHPPPAPTKLIVIQVAWILQQYEVTSNYKDGHVAQEKGGMNQQQRAYHYSYSYANIAFPMADGTN